jgi:hypothetical protein
MVMGEGERKRRFFRTSKVGRSAIALLTLLLVIVLLDRVWYAHIRNRKERLRVVQLGMTKEGIWARAGEPTEKDNSVWIYRYSQPMCQHGSPLVEFLLFGHVALGYEELTLSFYEDGTVSRIDGQSVSSGYLPRDLWLLFE